MQHANDRSMKLSGEPQADEAERAESPTSMNLCLLGLHNNHLVEHRASFTHDSDLILWSRLSMMS